MQKSDHAVLRAMLRQLDCILRALGGRERVLGRMAILGSDLHFGKVTGCSEEGPAWVEGGREGPSALTNEGGATCVRL